jgi:cyanophycinase
MLKFLVMVLMAVPLCAEVTRFVTGNPADVRPRLRGPALNLAGGGPDLDPAIQWMIDEVRGCTDCEVRVDVVVLRATGGNGYNDYIYAMNGVDSVETLVISSAIDGNRLEVAETVHRAEVVFFAGGDQCNYVRFIRGTRTHRAVEEVYARGGAVGGTSAGEAIQSPLMYDACTPDSAQSSVVLRDPYDENVSFTDDFLHWPDLENTFADQHFVERGRLGRLLVFMGRQIVDGVTSEIWGIGVDRSTALLVDRNGVARVMGEGPVILILADHAPEVFAPRTPVTFCDLKVWKFRDGDQFSLRTRSKTGFCLMNVIDGVIINAP